QRLADNRIRLLRNIAVRRQIVWAFVIERTDGALFDELDQLDRLLRLDLQLFQLLVAEQDVAVLVDLIALDDLVTLHRSDAGRDLLITDTFAGLLMDLMQGDRRRRRGGVVQADRNRNERQPEVALPGGSGRHETSCDRVRAENARPGCPVPGEAAP